MTAKLPDFSAPEWGVIIVSLVVASLLLIDPLVFSVVRDFSPEVRGFFRSFTDLGKSNWVLIPSGFAIAILLALRTRDIGLRKSAAYGYGAQVLGFVFAAVAGASFLGMVIKNTLGRARPKLYDELGSFDFHPFAYTADFASFPSGHATTAFAVGAVLAILFPKLRVYIFVAAAWVAATRFLIGAHYISDAVAGSLLGLGFVYLLHERLAERRWVFEKREDGTIGLRGQRLLRWMAGRLRRDFLPRNKAAAAFGAGAGGTPGSGNQGD